MSKNAAAVVRRLAKPALPLPALDDRKLAAAVAVIIERYPGNPRDSVRRSVALLYEALCGLFEERCDGTFPDPEAFRFTLATVARATLDLARRRGSGVQTIDQFEVRAILDALVAARVLVVLSQADATAPEGAERSETLAFLDG